MQICFTFFLDIPTLFAELFSTAHLGGEPWLVPSWQMFKYWPSGQKELHTYIHVVFTDTKETEENVYVIMDAIILCIVNFI